MTPYPNLTRWFNTLVNQPEFSRVVGKVEFTKEETQAPKAGKAPAAAAAPKAEKPKEEKAAAPAAAAAASSAPSNEDLMDELEKPKIKKANPLDALPESAMILDNIKKLCFSKRPFLPEFFEELW